MVVADLLEPSHQANGWLGQVGKVVGGQPGNLEVGDLVQVATVLSPQGHVMGQVKIHPASVHEGRLGLVVARVVTYAHECIVERVGGTEEESADAGQSVRTDPAGGGCGNHGLTGELMKVGLDIGLAEKGIEILLGVASVAVVALHGEPRVEVIAIPEEEAATLRGMMRDIDIVRVLRNVGRSLNADF